MLVANRTLELSQELRSKASHGLALQAGCELIRLGHVRQALIEIAKTLVRTVVAIPSTWHRKFCETLATLEQPPVSKPQRAPLSGRKIAIQHVDRFIAHTTNWLYDHLCSLSDYRPIGFATSFRIVMSILLSTLGASTRRALLGGSGGASLRRVSSLPTCGV